MEIQMNTNGIRPGTMQVIPHPHVCDVWAVAGEDELGREVYVRDASGGVRRWSARSQAVEAVKALDPPAEHAQVQLWTVALTSQTVGAPTRVRKTVTTRYVVAASSAEEARARFESEMPGHLGSASFVSVTPTQSRVARVA